MSSAICFNLEQSKILSSGNELNLYNTILTFNDSWKLAFENIVGKEKKNAGKQHFLHFPALQVFRKHCAISPFPKVFFTLLENFLLFSSNSKLLSAKSFSLEESNICHLGKG